MNRSRQKRGIGAVIALFSSFSVLLLSGAWYASNLAPSMMYRNYRSVKYASDMQNALTQIYLAATNAMEASPREIARFDSNLAAEKNNLTEIGEPEAVARLEANWSRFRDFKGTPSLESFLELSSNIEEITTLNEKAMFSYEERARTLSKTVLFGGLVGFALVFLYAIQIFFDQE